MTMYTSDDEIRVRQKIVVPESTPVRVETPPGRFVVRFGRDERLSLEMDTDVAELVATQIVRPDLADSFTAYLAHRPPDQPPGQE